MIINDPPQAGALDHSAPKQFMARHSAVLAEVGMSSCSQQGQERTIASAKIGQTVENRHRLGQQRAFSDRRTGYWISETDRPNFGSRRGTEKLETRALYSFNHTTGSSQAASGIGPGCEQWAHIPAAGERVRVIVDDPAPSQVLKVNQQPTERRLSRPAALEDLETLEMVDKPQNQDWSARKVKGVGRKSRLGAAFGDSTTSRGIGSCGVRVKPGWQVGGDAASSGSRQRSSDPEAGRA